MEQKRFPAVTQVIFPAFREWIDDWPRFILVTIIWLLGWLTIIFGPPFTFGLFFVTKNLAYGDVIRPGKLWAAAKRYFWISWLWMLINIVVLAVIAGNIFFYDRFKAGWSLGVQITLLFLAIMWLIVQAYTIPYLMEQDDKSLKTAMRNGFVTLLSSPGFTLVIIIFFMLFFVLSVVFIFPILLGVPCLMALIWSRAVRQRIEVFNDSEA